jgi:tetratricopeptide (TPR) repeat protein
VSHIKQGVGKVEKRWSDGQRRESQELIPAEDSFHGWFGLACQLAMKSQLNEAERAMKVALNMDSNYPQAWAILSAIYLSLGRETDAEQAGKKAIAQCADLKMTWPKLRGIILSFGIKKGVDWKSPKRVLLGEEATSSWGDALNILGKSVVEVRDKTDRVLDSKSIETTHDIESEKAIVRIPNASHKKRDVIPSISSRKIEGLTAFKVERLTSDQAEQKGEIEEKQSEPKRPTLPTFSSTKVADVTKKYDEPLREKPKPKDIPLTTSTQESASTWFQVGAVHLKKGNWDEAEKAYRRGLALEPENSEAWTQVGNLLIKKGNYREAEDALRVATKHSYKNVNAWYFLGVCLQQQNNWNEALIVLKTASSLDQNRSDTWLKLGESEFHIGQYQDAARSFLRTLRISPDNRDAMFYLAMCMERRGNRQHALSLYIKLLNIGDLPADMLERIAGAFERLDRPIEAREARRRAALARKIGS